MTDVRTTCPYCGVGCGVIASAAGEIRGDTAHPANQGRLCSKGSALGETLDDSGRLLYPRIAGATTTWDRALDEVANRFSATIAAHGPDSVAFYVSGQFLTEDYYVANKLMKGFIGSANIDTNSRLCMASTVAGHNRAFGGDVVPGIYEDWEEADLVVLVGSNTAWCHPVLYQRLAAARQKHGTRIINIDPRRTATSEIADLHLALAPGSDVLLFAGLLAYLAREGCVDKRWTGAHTNGLTEALESADATAGAIATIAAGTGLTVDEIVTFYDWFAKTERVVTVFSQGVNQSSSGTDKVNAIINCHLATGRIGRAGMGPFSITGQPNAMGGREVGGLANQLAAHVGFDDPESMAHVADFWNARSLATRPGLKAVDMFDAVHDGRIKAIWIMATNPVASLPRGNHVRAALEKCPFVVVSDCRDTDTTAYAHVVLPAAGWGEKDGTVTNSERYISRQRAFRPPPGEAKADWWMLTKVARRMGWVGAFSYQRPADIFREHAALSGFMNDGRRIFDISGLAGLCDDEYEQLTPIRWPVRNARNRSESTRLFSDGGFPTADGRARLVATPWRRPAETTTRQYPFVLNTGRIRDQWHTMTRTGLVPRLMTHQDEPYLELHPHDAGKLGLADGELVRVDTQFGSTILRARVSDRQRPGEAFAPMHWTQQFCSSGPINRLVTDARDPVSGQPELKATAARIAPVPTLWRGLLVNHAGEMPRGNFYIARIPGMRGQAFEMRGYEPLPSGKDLTTWVSSLLDEVPGSVRFEREDQGRGIYHFAVTVGGHLQTSLMLSKDPRGYSPDRDKIDALLGEMVDDLKLTETFSISASDQPRVSAGPIVCSCFSVRAATVQQAIERNNLKTTAQIGVCLQAGTNCGSCLPELTRMLRESELAMT